MLCACYANLSSSPAIIDKNNNNTTKGAMEGDVSETHVDVGAHAFVSVMRKISFGLFDSRLFAFSCVVGPDNLSHKQDGGMWVEAYS